LSKLSSPLCVLVFEDDAIGRLQPVVTARPGYAISCASFRLIDWLRQLGTPIYGAIREHLRTLQKEDFGLSEPLQTLATPSAVLIVNARIVPDTAVLGTLKKLISDGRSQAIRDASGALCAALLPAATSHLKITEQTADLPLSDLQLSLFNWPHDVVAQHMKLMNDAMTYRIAHGDYEQMQDGVFIRPGAKIGLYPVIDTSKGAVILEDDAQVGPFCYLSGPVHMGTRARVIEHSALKDGVSLGHTTKIGGEVEASVIEPYTNKQHHGFLGHSYLGSWINLGAGTCNSDLKNTYGHINMEYQNERVATEMQFMGCIMGDYSKSAINTGIFTGKIVGVCSMLYGFVTTNVPSYVTYARLFGQTSMVPADVMISTQARMFARRKVEQRPCDRQLILDMFDLTEDERASQNQLGL
jgi:UDP-N-acetylglucosamine diphosphorylase / glucose-1-phosphate thymidylyltransferase / UDP-N-acetylgalactosamine diphosphorylase / glucosamine-1-phosphate N-acetyltransferase / galactosamine-1-phosphate N-acetyltransferase